MTVSWLFLWYRQCMNDHWQLPPGVTAGTQEYFEADAIADDYDQYFAYTSLFQFDESLLLQEIGNGNYDSTVADFGCGTGRALVALGKAGHRGLAIDLSDRMLGIVSQKAREADLEIDCVKANLVQLEGFQDDCVDHGVCLFSTLGMIQGSANRLQAIRHFRRMIRGGGRLIVHVHNYWYNLYDPGGPSWLISNAFQSLFKSNVERGDRTYSYRGVYNMFLHVFRRTEIRRLLRQGGFRIQKMIPLNPTRMDRLAHSWWFSSLRCNGWIVVCN